jgi:hypothetical protein
MSIDIIVFSSRQKEERKMYIEFQNNPGGRKVGDCTVRALSKALSVTWEKAFAMLTVNAFLMADMPSSNSVLGAVLREHGFYRAVIPNTCPDCYTAADFCKDNPKGIYVLGFGRHVATVVNGQLFDSWNSENEIPQFVWYRRD